MALAYAQLVREVYSAQGCPISPSGFHQVLCKHGAQFRGYEEQDSHEFVQFLVNALHEDLNLVKEKPYVQLEEGPGLTMEKQARQAWDYYLQRNQSVVTESMVGQYITHIKCPLPSCRKESMVFDPFIAMPLPITGPQTIRYFEVLSSP